VVVITPHPFDPRIRRDGLCVVCRGERPPGAVAHADPFCSCECCKAYYALLSLARARVKVAGGL